MRSGGVEGAVEENISDHSKTKLFLQWLLLITPQSSATPVCRGVGVKLRNWFSVRIGFSRPASIRKERLLSRLSIRRIDTFDFSPRGAPSTISMVAASFSAYS